MLDSATDLSRLTVSEAAEKIAQGEIRSTDLVEACLARIAERDDEVRAWTHLDPDYARQKAQEADEARSTGQGIGPLHGVPIGIKDICDTADMPTEYGSAIFKGKQPEADASLVKALRDAGAIIMGKTVTTELAVMHPGKTRNPINPEHTPGGSSSGSAAAVADHMIPAAIGSQTGGSVLRPAAFCGVVGFKPTFGLISRFVVISQSPPLDTMGVIARTVDDAALVADCLSAFDPRDTGMWPRSRPPLYQTAIQEPPVTPHIAFVKSPVWDEAEDITKEALGELAEFLGEHCDEVDLPEIFTRGTEWQSVLQLGDIAKNYGPLLDKSPDMMSASLTGYIEDGRKITAVEYNTALEMREVLYAGLDAIFDRYDAILTPAAAGPAPHGLETTGSPIFNKLWTYLGVPAISLPLLEANGLPLGVQLVGPRRDDARLLRSARWLMAHVLSEEKE